MGKPAGRTHGAIRTAAVLSRYSTFSQVSGSCSQEAAPIKTSRGTMAIRKKSVGARSLLDCVDRDAVDSLLDGLYVLVADPREQSRRHGRI